MSDTQVRQIPHPHRPSAPVQVRFFAQKGGRGQELAQTRTFLTKRKKLPGSEADWIRGLAAQLGAASAVYLDRGKVVEV